MGEKTYSYEDKSDIVDYIIQKNFYKWFLTSISWMNYEDVSQEIRTHIFVKWYQWDQKRPLEPWLNRIVCNQIKNILRNNYIRFAKPCVTCEHNQSYNESGPNLCGNTKSGLQCNECPLYAKWTKTKQSAYNIKVPVSLEVFFYSEDHSNFNSESLNFAEKKLHSLMRDNLSSKHFFVYKMLFIDFIDEEEVAQILGYKTNEKGRKAGYKQIKNLKNSYKNIAKALMEEHDVFMDE